MRRNRNSLGNILIARDLGKKILRGLFADGLRILADRRQAQVRPLRDLDAVKTDDRDIFRNRDDVSAGDRSGGNV